ncbi:DUF6468 domain-containing protein [Chthonobacter rhizosphaerae]|uniref:DUF6468 domain-containing protein n=1 Tax=Chthonobacter rhizosphaerae TaxID=2735553 RepID=UPI0015EE8113|nr:DUF6468 domain-containing protein [Chthonobacter rhizosphaerae]
MTGLNLGMIIEIIVAVLLVLTIAYCMVLNKRLTRLRADEEVLRATISELITATEIAERAILGLKATAAECEKTLGGKLKAADGAILDLDRRITTGNDIVRRLVAIAGAASPAPQQPAPTAAQGAFAAPAYAQPQPQLTREAQAAHFAPIPPPAPAYAAPTYSAPAPHNPATAPREPVTRSLQQAAEAAAERLTAFRRNREEAA